MLPSDARSRAAASKRTSDLGRPVGERPRPREVPRERERERDGRVEVRAAYVTDGVDPEHDHEPEGDGNADVAELARLGVDHDRPAAGEDEREGADQFGDEHTYERQLH